MSYANSRVDWPALRSLASRVARETKVARRSRTETRQLSRTREVRSGFLGLVKKMERYQVPVTQTVVDDHWALEQRYWRRHDKGSGSMADETSHEITNYCLGSDGSLVVWEESWEEITPKGMAYFEKRNAPTSRPMTAQDVELLDFDPKTYRDGGRISVETNRDPDKQKPRGRTKGAGLIRALQGLLAH